MFWDIMSGMRPLKSQMRMMALALVCGPALLLSGSAGAQETAGRLEYGVDAKRPVLQASCKHCPWGALADILKKAMAPAGYDVAICYTCSGVNGIRGVIHRRMPPEINDRAAGHGITSNPGAPPDFGITSWSRFQTSYDGTHDYKADGPQKSLRLIAQIEQPSYFLVAVVKSSGIGDLHQIRERKMPARIMTASGSELTNAVLEYFGITKKEVEAWGGKFLEGGNLVKNPNFDVLIGGGLLSNYPEGNVWYEMTQKKDLVFLPLPDDLRQKLVKENKAEQVEIPYRYMRGVGDTPIQTVGISATAVYGLEGLPDAFVYDVAKALDQNRRMLKWANLPFSYDPDTVWDGEGVPLHPAAERYYRERGYMK